MIEKCPNCGSANYSTTLVGYIGKDLNKVSCLDCGEEGIAWKWEEIEWREAVAKIFETKYAFDPKEAKDYAECFDYEEALELDQSPEEAVEEDVSCWDLDPGLLED